MIVLVASFDIVVAVVFRFDIEGAVVLQSVQIILRWSVAPRAKWTRKSFSCCFFFALLLSREECHVKSIHLIQLPLTWNSKFIIPIYTSLSTLLCNRLQYN